MARNPSDAKWYTYPRTGTQFLGLVTNTDPVAAPDNAAVEGQNVFDNNGDKISTRPYGIEVFPTTATVSVASGGYVSSYTFNLRTGENILIVSSATTLYFYDETSAAYAAFRTGLSSGDFGYSEFNVNANAESRLYHGNGVDNFAYWNGGHTNLSGALVGGEATINVTSTSSFSASGTIIIGTTAVTYSGVTATSFTGCAGTPAAASGLAVAQAVTTDGAAPKGNIYMAAQNRLFINPANNRQLVLFSAYGDASSWSTTTVTSATAASAGAFNLVEGGGQVTAMVQDEQSIYFLKKSIIYVATLSDSLYTLQALKPFDSRSRSAGAVGRRGVFIGGNFVFVVTPDNQIKALQRLETIDYPQLKPISFPIQPTCDGLDFSSIAGVSYKDYAFFACKLSTDSAFNDVVLPFNLVTGYWETPIVGWNVAEWMIYDDGTGPGLYFADAVSPNVWRLTTSSVNDGPYIVTAFRKTKQYDFGDAEEQKLIWDTYVEGYITPNTNLTITLLLDEYGNSGVSQTIFAGTETAYEYPSVSANPFGVNPIGIQVFGANEDLTGLVKFRVHLNKSLRQIPFYVAQLSFYSSGENQRWVVTRYGFKVTMNDQPTDPALQRAFT